MIKIKMKHLMSLSVLLVVSILITLVPQAAGVDKEASISFVAGDMVLKSAPVIDFGKHKLKLKSTYYPANKTNDVVQIVDARGNYSGWSLQGTLSTFKDGSQEILPGASILIEPYTPVPVNSNGNIPSGIPMKVELVAGDQVNHTLVTAKKGEGGGTWDISLDSQNVLLYVPARSAHPGNYQAVMEWTLTDDPSI